MADSTSSIPPSNASRALSGGSENLTAGKTISAPPGAGNTNLPVERAPRQLVTKSDEPKTIEGKVIYSNPDTEEMRIATELGEIALKTKVNLPHDTKVAIRIYQRNGKTFADVNVLEEVTIASGSDQIVTDSGIEEAIDITKLPLIQEGQKIQASLIPSEKTQSIDDLLNIISKTDKSQISTMQLGIGFEQIDEILFGKQPEEVLNLLTLSKINNITSIIKDAFGIKSGNENSPTLGSLVQHAYSKSNTPPITKETPIAQPSTDNTDDLINILGSEALIGESKVSANNEAGTNLLLNDLENVESLTHQSLSAKKYRIDILKIVTGTLDKKEIRNHLIKINEETGNYHTPEYKELPIKVAKIESFTPKGQPIIKSDSFDIDNIYHPTESENFMLKLGVNIKEDMTIFFKAVPVVSSSTAEKINSIRFDTTENIDIDHFDPFSNKEWGALKKTIQSLSMAQPQAIHNITNILPNPTNNLSVTALLFLAALRFGSIKGWLGDNLRDLDGDTLDTITKDFTRLSNMSKDTTHGQWRTFSMPLYYDGNLEQMQIYLQNEGYSDNESGDNKNSRRFIFNVDLSNMGRMQLDGTIYKEKKLLNLIVRSENKLTDEVKNQIREKYSLGLEHANFKGDISFQEHKLVRI